MDAGKVTKAQLLKAARLPPPRADGLAVPEFGRITRSSLYAYLAESDKRVGRDWEVVENLLRCIAHLAKANASPVDIDYLAIQRSWTRLDDGRRSRRRSDKQLLVGLMSHSWIGGWDGAADAVLAHSASEEFTVWPPGESWLDSLARSVAMLSAAHQPELARDAAERLVRGATEEFGEASPKSLAARHALAFWTGQTGRIQRAVELTAELRADCRARLGEDHVLTRLAMLREAWWTGHMGRWHEANRLYIAMVRSKAAGPDQDGDTIRLLARWGMARTGGRAGNWMHAYTELDELLPSVIHAFGADHPAALDARYAHAWAAGRSGDPATACGLLGELAVQADAALGPRHPSSLRIRIGLACWTLRRGATSQALAMAGTLREQCESVLGRDHPLSVNAAEIEALCRFGSDPEAARTGFADVLGRLERRLGSGHPFTLEAAANHTAARGVVEGPATVVPQFALLAEKFGRAIGDEHPETLRVRMNLLMARLAADGPRSVHSECVRLVDSFSKVLGNDHPDTVLAADFLWNVERRIHKGVLASLRKMPSFQTHSDGWTGAGSDRDLKFQIAPLTWSVPPGTKEGARAEKDDQRGDPGTDGRTMDGYEILRAVAGLQVSTWSYLGEEDIRHLGPMAQDWYAALGLGRDDGTIELVDANGAAVVAIQALHRLVRDLQSEVRELRARLDDHSPH
ncbi:tail fiber domain-containing protein [Streptomyces sp. NPDC051987]|uniref:tail fiber domain-containing protein n=1 Tax=Streptomyces sp. NPDC051987 TaxID=3155808 RepID=UPI00343D40BE